MSVDVGKPKSLLDKMAATALAATTRQTRSRTSASGRLGSSLLGSEDIASLIMTLLDFDSFVAFRGTCREIREATTLACEGLIAMVESMATQYISPHFNEALLLASENSHLLSWLLQSPVVAVVAIDRYADLMTTAYHLLQAHFSRLQKVAVSNCLRRATNVLDADWKPCARFQLLHLSVRFGMFTETAGNLADLLDAARAAVEGIQKSGKAKKAKVALAAAHYTLAGFYTYHHRREELDDAPAGPGALAKAHDSLVAALRIQTKHLGDQHIATLCSQLVKAQVMLLQSNTADCEALLESQLVCCQSTLSSEHPLAAKMLAVKARVFYKKGLDDDCAALQQRVFRMRCAALGLHHEDTHRSAMDLYTRQRNRIARARAGYEEVEDVQKMLPALQTCLEMLSNASSKDGGESYTLSKSLQGMGELVFKDLLVLCGREVWPKRIALSLLMNAADVAERLPVVTAAFREIKERELPQMRQLRDRFIDDIAEEDAEVEAVLPIQ